MIAATRNEITKNNEWRIYDYVTRHFIASLHDDMEYVEKKLLVDISGFRFHYKWHEVCNVETTILRSRNKHAKISNVDCLTLPC